MTRTIDLLKQARDDVEDIYLFIGSDNPSAADAFIDCLGELLALVADNPHMATVRHFDKSGAIQVTPLSSPYENYLLFYRVVDNVIEVPRILHGARWRIIHDFFGDT